MSKEVGMTIDEAILLKEAYLRNPLCNLNKEERKADLISIEALKRHRDRYKLRQVLDKGLLPGETKDLMKGG